MTTVGQQTQTSMFLFETQERRGLISTRHGRRCWFGAPLAQNVLAAWAHLAKQRCQAAVALHCCVDCVGPVLLHVLVKLLQLHDISLCSHQSEHMHKHAVRSKQHGKLAKPAPMHVALGPQSYQRAAAAVVYPHKHPRTCRQVHHQLCSRQAVDQLLHNAAVLLHAVVQRLELLNGPRGRRHKRVDAPAVPVEARQARLKAGLQSRQLDTQQADFHWRQGVDDLWHS